MSEQFRPGVGDYNLQTGMLAVHQQKDRNKPKVRHVPLSKVGAEAYEKLAEGKKPGALFCTNTQETRMTDVTYWFKPTLKDAGITDYHWHDNRHSAYSRWVMGGVPLAAGAKYVGHSTIQMTMRYSHLVPKVNQIAVDAMKALYEGQTGIETATSTPKQLKADGGWIL
jgi:integrase